MTRKKGKYLSVLLCAAAFLASASAGAAGKAPEQVHAQLWTDRIYVDGVFVGFQNGQGRPVDAVFHNGTIYIPIRTAGEWMGCEVAWDQETRAVRLTSGGTPKVIAASDLPDATREELEHYMEQCDNGVTITIRPDLAVYLDDVVQQFTNVNGGAVYPVVLEDVTYLPVRNVGELCGKRVAWVPKVREDSRQMVAIYTPLTEEQKTAVRDYQSAVAAAYAELETAVAAYVSSVDGLAPESALEQLRGLEGCANKLAQIPLNVPAMEHERARLAQAAGAMSQFGAVYEDIYGFEHSQKVTGESAELRYGEQLATIKNAIDQFWNMAAAIGVHG